MATNLEFVKQEIIYDGAYNLVDFTNLFTDKYNHYTIFIDLEYNGASYLDIYLLDSGGSQILTSNYSVRMRDLRSNLAVGYYAYDNSTLWRGLGGYLNDIDRGYGLKLEIFNPTSTSTGTFALAQSVSPNSGGSFGNNAVATFNNNTGIYGLRINGSGGGAVLFTYIKLTVYGNKYE